MQKSKIEYTEEARKDILSILKYITLYLKEPIIANNLLKALIHKIDEVSQYPMLNNVIKENEIMYKNIRKIVIKNYLVFYDYNEQTNIMRILRILYGRRNWRELLK